jgi:hypothetical protein
LIKL